MVCIQTKFKVMAVLQWYEFHDLKMNVSPVIGTFARVSATKFIEKLNFQMAVIGKPYRI